MNYFDLRAATDDVSRSLAGADTFALTDRPVGFARVLRDAPPGDVLCSTWRAVPSVVASLVSRADVGADVRVMLDRGASRENAQMLGVLRTKIPRVEDSRSHAKLVAVGDRVVLTSANGGEVVGQGRDEWWYSTDHPGDLSRVRGLFDGESRPGRGKIPAEMNFSQPPVLLEHGEGGWVTVTPPGFSPLATLVSLLDGGDLVLCWWRPTVGFARTMRRCVDLGLVRGLELVMDDAAATRVRVDQGGRSRDEGLRAIRELLPSAKISLVRAPRTVHLKLALVSCQRVLLSSANWQETGPSTEAYVLLDDPGAARLVEGYVASRRVD